MISPITQFAKADSGGISSLGLNIKSFLFQLATFVIVLLILRRWVFPKLVATLEARRKTLEESLAQARQTEETLHKAEVQAAEILKKARTQADTALADAQSKAEEVISQSETVAAERAARIIKEAQEHLSQERQQLSQQLKKELAGLVAAATEKVLRKKLDDKTDRALIEQSLKELG